MSSRKTALLALSALLASALGASAVNEADSARHSKLVYPGKDGKLVYEAYSDKGDKIPDFSNCGYKGGDAEIPMVPVRATVEPVDGDDTDVIQSAIDKVSKLPLDKMGQRGAVLIKKGRYELSKTIKLDASGVVLRGEGDGEDGTVLVATWKSRDALISVGGSKDRTEVKDSRQQIMDDYVPVGARSFKVKDASSFRVGQNVIVFRPSTAEWISFIGMDRMTGPTVVNWKPGDRDLPFDRVITKVKGDTITVDAPIANAIQKEFGGGWVYRYDFPSRINNVGVESIRGESSFDPEVKKGRTFTDEKHSWGFISINNAQNVWVRNVTSRYFANNCVNMGKGAKWVTVKDSKCLEPVSEITGGRRYSFHIGGQLCLVRDCYSKEARHDFVVNANTAGPNAFLNCKAENTYCTSEPHQRYAVGTLFDNVSVTGDGYMQAINRGNSGTGHGWSGAQMVFWNCRAHVIAIMKPPAAQNFAIGSTGWVKSPGVAKGALHWMNNQSKSKFTDTGFFIGDGWMESPDAPVSPQSLYLKQLEDRHSNKK